MPPFEQVLNDSIAVFPSFRGYWEENGQDFQDESGAYTACAVFLVLTWFVFERSKRFSTRQWRRFGLLAKKYFDLGEPTQGILGACLIEHLEGREFSGEVLRHFDRELLQHYCFHGAGRKRR
jgi:hypothetical protein